MHPAIAYYGVPTERQNLYGFGLKAQAERCTRFAAQNWIVVSDDRMRGVSNVS